MAIAGPILVVSEAPAAEFVAALGNAAALPVVETRPCVAAAAITKVQPAALLFASRLVDVANRDLAALVRTIETRRGPIMPVLMDAEEAAAAAMPFAVPFSAEEPAPQFLARLRAALRVRELHATVLGRMQDSQVGRNGRLPDLLASATVLYLGRGRSYPALFTAIDGRLGLIGSLSLESADRTLKSRDIDGIVVDGGLSPKALDTFLAAIAKDQNYRHLPVGILGDCRCRDERLPNLFCVDGDLSHLIAWLMPLVRMHALASHLNRMLKSLNAKGAIDCDTGLTASETFWHDLDIAIAKADAGRGPLSVARFSFDEIDSRSSIDAARLFSRLVRNVDFACRESDGSIIAAFTGTDLRSAHVVARRIAGILRQSMVSPDRGRNAINPTVTLATLKPMDNLATLAARICACPKDASATVAAG